MKLFNLTPYQRAELDAIHPEKNTASYAAFVPNLEYQSWKQSFATLLQDVDHYFGLSNYPHLMEHIQSLPLVQCVAKFERLDAFGVIQPKVFKWNILSEGNIKDLGISHLCVNNLSVVTSSLKEKHSYLTWDNVLLPKMDRPLAFLAWDEQDDSPQPGDRYLPLFATCFRDLSQLKVEFSAKDDRYFLNYKGRRTQSHLITSYNYYSNPDYQIYLKNLNELGLVSTPLGFPLGQLRAFTGFKSPLWASVRKVEDIVEKEEFKDFDFSGYYLIRVDEDKIYSPEAIMNNPLLQLELEITDLWALQEGCQPLPKLEHLNLYWTYSLEYPWLLDRRTQQWVPVFVVEDV